MVLVGIISDRCGIDRHTQNESLEDDEGKSKEETAGNRGLECQRETILSTRH